jgi:hypothetical protein
MILLQYCPISELWVYGLLTSCIVEDWRLPLRARGRYHRLCIAMRTACIRDRADFLYDHTLPRAANFPPRLGHLVIPDRTQSIDGPSVNSWFRDNERSEHLSAAFHIEISFEKPVSGLGLGVSRPLDVANMIFDYVERRRRLRLFRQGSQVIFHSVAGVCLVS